MRVKNIFPLTRPFVLSEAESNDCQIRDRRAPPRLEPSSAVPCNLNGIPAPSHTQGGPSTVTSEECEEPLSNFDVATVAEVNTSRGGR